MLWIDGLGCASIPANDTRLCMAKRYAKILFSLYFPLTRPDMVMLRN